MQRTKRGNSHPLPKHRKRGQPAPATVAQPVEPTEHVQLTLHDSDPITSNEDILSTLFYEFYRGYTIYSTVGGRCCIHGKQGCIKLRGKFVCFPDVEEAKTLIKRFRAEGYTSSDSVERYLPEWECMRVRWREQQQPTPVSRPMQRVSSS